MMPSGTARAFSGLQTGLAAGAAGMVGEKRERTLWGLKGITICDCGGSVW